MAVIRWSVMALIVLTGAYANAQPDRYRDPWFFTAEEIEAAYRYQSNFGERIHNPMRARDCLFGKKDFVASFRGKEFRLSCRFITETIRHVKEMIAVGAARYLFPLDVNHAHLAVPIELWQKKYRKLPPEEIFPAILEEPGLVALYHTAEHLSVVDPTAGKTDPKVKAWKEKRNVLGFYDGRPIKILPPRPSGAGVGVPSAYESYGGFTFLASPKGHLCTFVGRQAHVFDIALDSGETNDEALDPSSMTSKTTH